MLIIGGKVHIVLTIQKYVMVIVTDDHGDELQPDGNECDDCLDG